MLLPLLLFAGALLLRCWGLGFEAHFDELWFLELSSGHGSEHITLPRDEVIVAAPALSSLRDAPSLWHIPQTLKMVMHPPIYPMALRLWRMCFGESILASRWFSAILSAMCVPVLFDSVRLLNGRWAAFWASVLLMLSATQITCGQEIRNYALTELLLLAAVDSLMRIEAFGVSRLRVAALLISATATLYAHYYALPAIVGMGVYSLLRLRGQRHLAVASALLVSGLAMVPWVPTIFSQLSVVHAQLAYWPTPKDGPHWLAEKFAQLVFLPVRLLFEPMRNSRTSAMAAGVMLLILPWLYLRRKPQLLLWIILMQSSLAIIFLIDVYQRLTEMIEIRHSIIAAVGLCPIVPLLASTLRGWLRQVTPAVVAIACIPSINLRHEPNFEHFSGLAMLAGDSRYRHEPIIFLGREPFLWWSDVMLLGVSSDSGTFPRPLVRADGALEPSLVKQLRHWPGAVLVYETGNGPPERIVPGSQSEPIGTEAFLANVAHLTWTQPEPPTDTPLIR